MGEMKNQLEKKNTHNSCFFRFFKLAKNEIHVFLGFLSLQKNEIHVFFRFFKLAKNEIHVF